MRLRFPVLMKTSIKRQKSTHLFDDSGERIAGEAGNGPRLQVQRLHIRFQMEGDKTYTTMRMPLTAQWPRWRPPPEVKRRAKQRTPTESLQAARRVALARAPGKRVASKFSFTAAPAEEEEHGEEEEEDVNS